MFPTWIREGFAARGWADWNVVGILVVARAVGAAAPSAATHSITAGPAPYLRIKRLRLGSMVARNLPDQQGLSATQGSEMYTRRPAGPRQVKSRTPRPFG